MCWLPMRWCFLDLQQAVGHRIQSLERTPHLFVTDNARKSLLAAISRYMRVFPCYMDSDNPITIFSHMNFQIITAASEVKVFRRPILSATSSPELSALQTHLLRMNHMSQTWCAWSLVPDRPGIEYVWSGTQLSLDWRIGQALSSLNTSWRHWYSNLLLIVLRTRFNTELVYTGSWISSQSSTCYWTSLPSLSVFFSSSTMSFSSSDIRCVDGLIFQQSWNPSQC